MQLRQNLLATMLTTTTYGAWLPGDVRGYVDDGVILPGNPALLQTASRRMTGNPVLLNTIQQQIAFDALRTASAEFHYRLLAVAIESWHVHLLIDHKTDAVATVAGRLKTRMRQALGGGRIWTVGYDKRYCFTPEAVTTRAGYIHRHPGHRQLVIDQSR